MFNIKKKIKLLGLDQWFALILFLLLLSVWLVLPVYSDEVVTKFNTSNLFNHYGNYIGLFPQCQSSTPEQIPWIFYPASFLMSFTYGFLDVLGLKILGILIASACLLMLALLLKSRLGSRWLNGYFVLVPFLFLGVVPLSLLMSRPEQILVLTMLMAAWLVLRDSKHDEPLHAGLKLLGFMIFSLLAIYIHPKAVFYLPFFGLAAYLSARSYGRLPAIGMVGFVLFAAYTAIDFNSKLLSCTDAPFVRKVFLGNTLLPEQALANPGDFFQAVVNNLLAFGPRLINHSLFLDAHQSGWLPPLVNNNLFVTNLNKLISYTLFGFIIIANTLPIILFVKKLFQGSVHSALLLAVAIALGNWLNAAIFNHQNFYSLAQYIPISLIILAMLFSDAWFSVKSSPYSLLIEKPQLILATVSVVTLLVLYSQVAYRFERYSTADIPGQPLSIPSIGTSIHFRSIKDLSSQSCKLDVDSNRPMVLDHLSYYVYRKTTYPIHVLYVSELGYGGDLQGNKLIDFLKEKHVAGVAVRCSWIPAVLKPWEKKNNDGYCCVNLDDVDI